MAVLNNLKPERVFYYFEEICGIPHGSGNTKQISDFLVNFAREHGLDYVQEENNNVIIRKPGSAGYENSEPVILQGHMDMVCEKDADSRHDFERDGLSLVVEGDLVRAKGTTLGGDDGIAVAISLAVLEDEMLDHPPLEVVLTVDEEVGLLGADALDFGLLRAKRMINLDSEEEGILYISCAGGMCSKSVLPVRRMESEGALCRISIGGLIGGHSGTEIWRCGANAHVLMGRLLLGLRDAADFALAELSGGAKETAIARACSCLLVIGREDVKAVEAYAAGLEHALQKEYAGIEDNLFIRVETEGEGRRGTLHPVDLEKIIFYLNNIPNGVQKMSGTIEGLVETSNNIGGLKLDEDRFTALSAPRSSVESARDYVADKIRYLTEFLGGEYTQSGVYPAWEYRKDSALQKVMAEVFEQVYGKQPAVTALHAGLECGLFYKNIDGLDCVSIGPDVLDVHTTKEHMGISSVERTYRYLREVLKALK